MPPFYLVVLGFLQKMNDVRWVWGQSPQDLGSSADICNGGGGGLAPCDLEGRPLQFRGSHISAALDAKQDLAIEARRSGNLGEAAASLLRGHLQGSCSVLLPPVRTQRNSAPGQGGPEMSGMSLGLVIRPALIGKGISASSKASRAASVCMPLLFPALPSPK